VNQPETWPSGQPQPGTEDPSQGGMSQLAGYEAGLTDDPGCWVQPVQVYWSPRLDPGSPEYDPEYVARVEWEEPNPAETRAQAEAPQPDAGPQPGPEPDKSPEPDLPF
jgi:hypothetical protein